MLEFRSSGLPPALEKSSDSPTGLLAVGYAAVWDSLSEDLGGFREVIKRGSFRKTLNEQDVWALFAHQRHSILGRTSAGTLKLEEDDRGLRVAVALPDTTLGRDLAVLIGRRDVRSMSFGFRPIRDRWSEEKGYPLRTLEEVSLHEVSFVPEPAYQATVAGLA